MSSVYTVQSGDTLYAIAQNQYGNGNLYPQIVSANPEITDPNQIFVGEQITLPDLNTSGSIPAAPPITQTALAVSPTTSITMPTLNVPDSTIPAPSTSGTVITLSLMAAAAAAIWYYMTHVLNQEPEEPEEPKKSNPRRKVYADDAGVVDFDRDPDDEDEDEDEDDGFDDLEFDVEKD